MYDILLCIMLVAAVIAMCSISYVFKHGTDDKEVCHNRHKVGDMTVGELIGVIIVAVVMCIWCFAWAV